MNKTLLVFFGCLSFAKTVSASNVKCPPGDKVAWGITTAKPKDAQELKSISVTPPIYGSPDEWDLGQVSNKGKRRLYLSCAYKNAKIYSGKISLKKQKCKAVNYSKDLWVSCVKR